MRAGRVALVALLTLAAAASAARAREDVPYRTPRAGEAFEEEVFGTSVSVSRRDRKKVLALTLGGALYDPPIGGAGGSPIFNLYWLRFWEDRRVYGLFSGAYDLVEYGERLVSFDEDDPGAGLLEGVVLLENYTLPIELTETTDRGREADDSEVWWGRIALSAGPGLRRPVYPFAVGNELRVQLLAHGEWQYFEEADDTPDAAIVPPETFVYGGRLRLRLDMLERNLLELPHLGFACGGDVDLLRRDPWREAGLRGPTGTRTAPKEDTRTILRVHGYALAALGLPGLSERHRLIAQVHAGWAPRGTVDRFSAFRFGAGPIQSEVHDLARVGFPVAAFNQIVAEEYVVGALTYRFEALFFFYPHVRLTAAWGRVGAWDPTAWRLRFEQRSGISCSGGFTTGFVLQSQLFVEYGYGQGFAREREDTHHVFVMWSKSF